MTSRAPLLSLLCAAALGAPARAQSLPGATWEIVGDMDSPVAGGVVVPLGGARALLVGVYGRDLRRVDLYDPAHGLTRVADAPVPLRLHFGVALDGSRVLVGGGGDFFDRANLSDRCFLYDTATKTWSETAPLPRPSFYLYGNTAIRLPDGRAMVTGGSTPAEAYYDPSVGFDVYLASRNVFLYDPLSKSWREGPPMPATRTFATHAPSFGVGSVPLGGAGTPPLGAMAGRVAHKMVIRDGQVLLIGGREYNPGSFYGVAPVDSYDPYTDAWKRIAELPSVPGDGDGGYGGRGFPGATVLTNGEVLVVGGRADRLVQAGDEHGRVTFDRAGSALPRGSALVLDPDNVWRQVGDLGVRRHGPLTAAWGGGAVAIGGGGVVFGVPLGAEVYDPSTETWSTLPPEPGASWLDFSTRQGTALDDDTVLTWSAVPYWEDPAGGGQGGLRTAKRLRPTGD